MSTPDFVEPVAGYRVWGLDGGQRLRAWTAGTTWEPGVNRAGCHVGLMGGGPSRRHPAPNERCSCGLYALNDPRDARIGGGMTRAGGLLVKGAIAAWGDLMVHPSGFRAELACVLALVLRGRAGEEERARVQAAAEAYGVPVVDDRRLEAAALAHAAPIAWEQVPVRRPAQEPGMPPAEVRRGRGGLVEHHLWVREEGSQLVVGVGHGLAGELGRGELLAPRVGQRLQPGTELAALLAPSGPLILTAPVSGLIVEVNDGLPALAEDPAREDDAWLVRLTAAHWPREAAGLSWGRSGELAYATHLACAADPFEELRPRFRRAAQGIRSFADVRAHLQALDGRPRFEDAGAFHAEVVDPLRLRLATDPTLRAHLGRAATTLALRLHDPCTEVRLQLRPPAATIPPRAAHATGRPDVTVDASADLAADYLLGCADLVSALRRGDAVLHGRRDRAHLALSALAELVGSSRTAAHRRPRPPLPAR